jgi:hypothetical protein
MLEKKEDRFGYPMNFLAYMTRGIIWGERQIFAKLMNGINDHRPIPQRTMSFGIDQQRMRNLKTLFSTKVAHIGKGK